MDTKTAERLSKALAEYYPERSSIRKIVRESGIILRGHLFDGSTVNIWQQILEEVDKQQRLFWLRKRTIRQHPTIKPYWGDVARYRFDLLNRAFALRRRLSHGLELAFWAIVILLIIATCSNPSGGSPP